MGFRGQRHRRGIVPFRTLINDKSRIAEIDAARHYAACSPYTEAGRIMARDEAPPGPDCAGLKSSPAFAAPWMLNSPLTLPFKS
jgi:hypothetical protein